MADRGRTRPARTVLEQLIWDRGETLTEFVDYANQFAQETGEVGTLSERNLKRLTAGPSNSRPRPATARLLVRIFGVDIEELLSSPAIEGDHLASKNELRTMIASSKRVSRDVIALLHEQLNTTRRLDRELGAIVAHSEVTTKIHQVNGLMSHSLTQRFARTWPHSCPNSTLSPVGKRSISIRSTTHG